MALVAALLSACAMPPSLPGQRALVEELAHTGGLARFVTGNQEFQLLALRRGTGAVLHVYIAGDGRAWATRRRPSRDPTPRDPLALRLALRDAAPAVAWIARPCQYLGARSGACAPRYWTSHRYSPEVIEALDVAVSTARRLAAADRVVLIGYSGGGTVAALLAARRDDVSRLITVVANLDHQAWTRMHGDTPLAGSLNPARLGRALGRVPQTHFVGARDRNVPPRVVAQYRDALPAAARVTLVAMPAFDHRCCWVERWPRLLRQALDAGR